MASFAAEWRKVFQCLSRRHQILAETIKWTPYRLWSFLNVQPRFLLEQANDIKLHLKIKDCIEMDRKVHAQIVSQMYCGSCHRRAFQAFAIRLLFDGKWPDWVRCLTLPGKIVTCQSSVKWHEFRRVPSSTECNSLIFVYCVTFHFIQSPFLLVEIPQQLALQSEFLMLRTFFFLLQMIARSSSWRIGHVNFSRRAGDVRSNLVAMATKMVATWRVAEISSRLKLTTKCNLNTANET